MVEAPIADPSDRLGASKQDRADKSEGDQEQQQSRSQGDSISF